jgi:hypothetical protein
VRVALVLTVAVGYAFGLIVGTTALVGRGPPPAPRPTAVVWADRVFISRPELAAWLEARGSDYSVWAVRHPTLAGTFDVRFGEPMAIGLEGDGRTAADRGAGGSSTLLLIIATVILTTVAAVLTSRATRRFAYNGRIDLRNIARRVRRRDPEPHRSSSARVRTAVTPARTAPRPPLLSASRTAALGRLRARPIPRGDLAAALRRLQRAPAELRYGAARMLFRPRLRRLLPTLAWYGTSCLIAAALGAFIAAYTK